MTTQNIPTIFESFNARNLAPEQVAKTFVAPNHFKQLIGQHHTLILGPRGSGKTTLLKMLQQPALDAWDGDNAEDIRKKINYYSVYIATDVSWGKQISSLVDKNEMNNETKDILAVACFTTHILIQLTKTMDYLIKTKENCKLSEKKEAEVAKRIAKTWKIEDPVVSLFGIISELQDRIVNIHSFASRETVLGEEKRKERILNESFLHLSFLPCCSAAVEIFNHSIHQANMRWAFLFDELEIAPSSIRHYLMESLRSVDERFIFKLSLAPFGDDLDNFDNVFSASPGQDYKVITLWYSHKDESKDFCTSLWNSMLQSRNLPLKTPVEYLGPSIFDTDSDEWKNSKNAYYKDGKLATRFSNLEEKDFSFKRYLRDSQIDLSNLESLPPSKRAAYIRKATSIVAIREAFIEYYKDQSDFKLRSRHSTDLYTGANAVFAITEGNPRWFKGMIGPMLDSIKDSETKITTTIQNREIDKAIQRFRALLRTIPGPKSNTTQQVRGLLTLLDKVGDFFHEELVQSDFSLDPPGTFTVDSRTNDILIEGLVRALNAGALVSLDPLERPNASIRGKRLRIAYLLAPHYKLLLRVERSVSLSHVNKKRKDQQSLF